MKNKYKELVLEAMASSLQLDFISLRFFPVVPFLPNSDCELFSLFNIIPSKGFIFRTAGVPQFSATYWDILQSQKSSFIITTAIKSYENQHFWLTCGSSSTPVYTPGYTDISSSLENGSSFDFSFDSSDYPTFKDPLFPSYPNFVIDQTFLNFNETASGERFTLTAHFDKVATIPVSAGGWFSNAAFVSAYKNQDSWTTGPGTVTWDSVFGTDGILQFITNGILVASGATFVIQSFGQYDSDMLNALKTSPATAVWPLYLNGADTVPDFELCTDGSIKITITTAPSDILLLAMQVANVQSLMG